jgi:hypothetical protein
VKGKYSSIWLQTFGLLVACIFLMPFWVQADSRISPDGGPLERTENRTSLEKIAIGPCQAQCFEGSVEYNPGTLEITKIERYDEAQKVWTDASTATELSRNATARAALEQVSQNMTLPGVCPEAGCICRLPAEKPPFSPWTRIAISSDYMVKSSGKSINYRAHGTVEYRSRVIQGQCDLGAKTSGLH